MEQNNRDETRWLARLLSVIAILLGGRATIVLIRRITAFSTSLPLIQQIYEYCWIFIGAGASILLFWVGYKLWKCSSLWSIAPWLTKEFPSLNYFQCQYFRINKHVRGGLIAGAILLTMVAPLPLMFYHYKGVWFWDVIKRLYGIILWPLTTIVEALNISHWPLANVFFFILWVIYLVAIGFVIGVSISYLMGRVIHKPSIQNLPK